MKKNKRPKRAAPFVMPAVGDIIYLESMLYLSHGRDDFHGGKCRISKVIAREDPTDPYIEVAEWPGIQCRYRPLLEEQEELKAEYGDSMGHLCPDTRPEFNDDYPNP